VNSVLSAFGVEPIYFLIESGWFRPIIVVSSIYQGVGWSSIVYLAVIASIETEQYESAVVDGAGRYQQMLYITLPSMGQIISILFVFAVSGLLNAGFDQIFSLYNPLVYSVGDVLDTYVYRLGLVYSSYSMSTAIGLARNVVGFFLLLLANYVMRRLGESGVW
jgi:putative aldouronate transport system permease protein